MYPFEVCKVFLDLLSIFTFLGKPTGAKPSISSAGMDLFGEGTQRGVLLGVDLCNKTHGCNKMLPSHVGGTDKP